MRTKQLLISKLPQSRCSVFLLLFVYALYGCGGNNTPALPIIDLPPSITALPTPASVAENQTTVITVSAYDPEGKSLIYSLTGTDASALSISTSGVITFNFAPDYETKNTYTVIVNVSDGTNLASPQTLNINITDRADVWIQKGLDIDGEAAGDYSGTRVSLSSDGTIVAIGATENDGNGDNAGHVRVYAWNGTAWIQRGLDIDGEAAGDKSGRVSISSDGTTLAIGATENDGNGDNAGHVRVYSWNGTAWIQRGLDIDGEAAGDKSGNSVSLSSDGTIVAIGALYNYGDDIGHTRVYAWNGTAWIQRGLDIDGEAVGDLSGNAVSLSSDGTILAVGAKRNDGNGDSSGHVRVYAWNGTVWIQRGLDIDGEAVDNFSGQAVSLNNGGTVVAIGAPWNNDNGDWAGHVRVYAWNGTAWIQRGLDIDGEAAGDLSGLSVSLSSDGTVLAIGAYSNADNGRNSGHARVYSWNGTTWIQRGLDIDGEAAGDLSGRPVLLSNDGTVVAIGGSNNDGNGDNAGHVRVFSFN